MIQKPSLHNATALRRSSKWFFAATALVVCCLTGFLIPDASTNTRSTVTAPAAKAAQDTKTNLDYARLALEQAQATEKASPTKKNGLATDAAQAAYNQALDARVTELVTRLTQLKTIMAQSEFSKSGPPVSPSVIAEFNAIRAELDSLKPYYNFNTRASQPVPASMVTEVEPNGTSATATPLTITPADPAAIVTLTINPAADVDFFSFSATAGSRVWAYVDTGSPPAQVGTSRDSQLRLLNTDGTTEIEEEDDDANGNGGDGTSETGSASCIAGRSIPATGTYFLQVNTFNSTDTINPCTLYVVVTSTSTPEVESNNTAATATPLITAGEVVDVGSASIGVSGDADYYSIVCEAGDILSVNTDCDPENNGSTDLILSFRDPSDVELFRADSNFSTTARGAEGFSFLVPTAGTYFVRVTAFSSGTGTYDLMVARASASGGGGGECMPTTTTYNYTGPVVAIPDGNAAGVTATLNVSGFTGTIGDLNFRFDGSSCSATEGSTTVGLDHSWVGDLIVRLTSPGGTTVTMIDRIGVPASTFGNQGNNFCQTVLDSDGGAPPIENAAIAENPFNWTYSPNNSLDAFDGEDPNGTWTLLVSDNSGGDTGSIRAFSLDILNVCEMEMGCTNPNVTLLVADTTNSRIQRFTAASVTTIEVNGTLGSGSPDCSSVVSGVQSGRIFRNGIPSACPTKVYPGISNVGTNFNYDAYTFTNTMAAPQCITVNFDPTASCGVNAHASAYLTSYNPADQPTNFVGDVGSSIAQPFSFEVPANGTFLVVVTNTASQSACNYQFTVVGNVFCGTAAPPANWSVLMSAGTTIGKVKNPKGVTQTSDGVTIYVADTGNNRIQKSTDSGATWAVLPNTTAAPPGFKSPAAVAVKPDDPNIVYVADTGNNRVLASSDGGASWSLLAAAGSTANQVRGPEGLVADCEGHLWIADTLNNRIVAYEPVEPTQATAPVTPGSGIVVAGIGSALNQVRAPKAVTVDVLTGDLFVADTGNNRVTHYTNGPVCTAVTPTNASLVAGPGSALGQVRSPAGITISGGAPLNPARGFTKVANTGVVSLVIGDTLNNRIQRAELAGPTQVGAFSLLTGATAGQTATIGSATGQFRAPTGVR